MFCPECGLVAEPGPLDARKSGHQEDAPAAIGWHKRLAKLLWPGARQPVATVDREATS